MVSEQPTRSVVQQLRTAGFSAARRRGSHTVWVHPGGSRAVVPDGHRTISPGVYRTVLAAIEASQLTPAVEEEE
jgi:predicted RNA binding protein YcfA (HicA-like mRNA interferase family)